MVISCERKDIFNRLKLQILERISHYFPELSKLQYQQFEQLEELYKTQCANQCYFT